MKISLMILSLIFSTSALAEGMTFSEACRRAGGHMGPVKVDSNPITWAFGMAGNEYTTCVCGGERMAPFNNKCEDGKLIFTSFVPQDPK